MQNASLVGMVEITYPLFTILFAYIFFKEFHLNVFTMLGGMLILSGVFLMYLKG
jgi:drug/metabolite transporter (DMT)-like permease